MANTTFNGPVRSQNGFQDITTNTSTGAVTVNSTYDNDASIGGTLSVTGVSTFAGNAGPAAGTGITTGTGTIYASTVNNTGGMWHTSILMDLTGLASSGSGDIIGKAGTASSNIGTTTVALNGTILGGKLTCVETPAGGDPDIDLWYADESTGAEDAAITSLSNQIQMLNSGDLAAGSVLGIPVPPAAGKFMYLVTGAATNADYTAGKILIEFFGYDA
jgi:hypothetical protein